MVPLVFGWTLLAPPIAEQDGIAGKSTVQHYLAGLIAPIGVRRNGFEKRKRR